MRIAGRRDISRLYGNGRNEQPSVATTTTNETPWGRVATLGFLVQVGLGLGRCLERVWTGGRDLGVDGISDQDKVF